MTPISKKDLEALAEVDVLSKGAPTEVDNEIEEKIKTLQKGSSVSIKLTAEELTRCKREAQANGMDWQVYLKMKVAELFVGNIGRSSITGPSFAKQGNRVTGPSWMKANGNQY
jgi:hypothetical protein